MLPGFEPRLHMKKAVEADELARFVVGKIEEDRARFDPVGDVADGRSRADVRPGRLLQQIRRQGL